MDCTLHSDSEAVGACTYCGKFFCQDCLINVNGRNYCRGHVGKAVEAQSSQVQPSIVINNNNINSNVVGNGLLISPKSRTVAALLCFFLGVFGIHRFYVGRIATGILYLLTWGVFGFGALFDFISILIGSFRDQYGSLIKNW